MDDFIDSRGARFLDRFGYLAFGVGALSSARPSATSVRGADVFMGGVLCTQSASSMGQSLLGVRPVAVVMTLRRAACFSSLKSVV
jgi:hypothetical protein